MYRLSLLFMRLRSVHDNAPAFMLLFWFNLMNVGNFYDYVPIRTFASADAAASASLSPA